MNTILTYEKIRISEIYILCIQRFCGKLQIFQNRTGQVKYCLIIGIIYIDTAFTPHVLIFNRAT